MEGPSLLLASQQLSSFAKQTIQSVEGNTRIGKERLLGEEITNIFAYGKTLIFQFRTFALRVHFMLYGSFEAIVEGIKVNGEYPHKTNPRLALKLPNGQINLYNCSLRYIEQSNAIQLCDYTTNIMSQEWDSQKALKCIERKTNRDCRCSFKSEYFYRRRQYHKE